MTSVFEERREENMSNYEGWITSYAGAAYHPHLCIIGTFCFSDQRTSNDYLRSHCVRNLLIIMSTACVFGMGDSSVII